MSSAVEKLATELIKLSADEWTRLDEVRIASKERDALLGKLSDAEIGERLNEIERAAIRKKGAVEPLADAPRHACIKSRNQQ